MRIFIAVVISFFWSLHVNGEDLVLEIGSSELIQAPSSGAVRVKNGKVVSVADLGAKLRLTGKKAGHATVTTAHSTTDVYVLSKTQYLFYKEASTEVEQMRGLEISVEPDGIVLSGRLLRLSDWQILSEIPNASYIFRAQVDDAIREQAREFITKRLSSANLALPVLSFDRVPKLLISKEQASTKNLYVAALAPLGMSVESTSSVVELQPLVRVKIAVTEVRKKFMQRFGVSWPSSAKAQLLPAWVAPGKAEGINVQLDALEENGFGKILASPTILCRSGKNAEFFAGGEFPIKVVGHKTREVTWKKHGIILKVAPVADHSGRMSIGLTTEVSTIDQSQTVEGVPGLLTNRIESHFDLSRSRTIALSGLLREESGNSREGLPALSSVPILGLLFSSQDYRDHKTELIVFVTPEVVDEKDSEHL